MSFPELVASRSAVQDVNQKNQHRIPTIAAVATPAGKGGIGIIRVSGAQTMAVAQALAPQLFAKIKKSAQEFQNRHAYFAQFFDASLHLLDSGLLLFFQGPKSYTGEDVLELQTHGAPALLQRVLQAVLQIPEVRLAEPGEFTRRAFMNGRIDLIQAEGVLQAIESENEAQVQAAAAVFSREFTSQVDSLENELTQLRAAYEGALDFPEEAEDTEPDYETLKNLAQQAALLLRHIKQNALLRRGARVVLYGPVNAGKSTLFNALLGSTKALVDAEAGTTRDALEAAMSFGQVSGTLVDTAGLREQPGRLEARGIELTRGALESADIAVLVVAPESTSEEVLAYAGLPAPHALLVVLGKADVCSTWNSQAVCVEALRVSGTSGQGIEDLRQLLGRRLSEGVSSAVRAVDDRQSGVARRVVEALERGLSASQHSTLEVVSGELGLAAQALGELTGTNVSEAVLDALFERFCIGK
jgi:tRNA modification GTPase